jgi:hypothetical protein
MAPRTRKTALLDEAFSRLHPWVRGALVLQLLEDQPLGAIARCLGTEPQVLARRLRAAVEHLQDTLAMRGLPLSGEGELRELLRFLPAPSPSPGFQERLVRAFREWRLDRERS